MTALLELTPEPFIQDLNLQNWNSPITDTITTYFARLNQEDYEGMAQLFAANGILFPPFEEPVIGPDAIAQYLKTEAVGMRAYPKTQQALEFLPQEQVQPILVRGKVQLPLFSVNVAWDFAVNGDGKIQSVRVDLLASLEELVGLRQLRG